MDSEYEEPLSPGGRLFVQPATHQIINIVFGLERPITLDALQTVISGSLLIKHPRFSSLLVTDNHGREHWRKTEIDINRHIIIRSNPVGEGDNNEEVVNEYLADLTVLSPLTTDKPLWEVHLLSAHKCLVLRIQHALGDGISLVSLMLTLCRKLDDPEQTPTIGPLTSSTQKHKNSGTLESILKLVKMVWFTLVYVFEFMMRGAWVKDGKTEVRGGEGVELWPRKLVTAKFSFEDMKAVKSAVANATINDVLFGVISSGLSKYLDSRSPDSLPEGLQMTGVALVNLRPSPGLQDIKELMKKNAGTAGWGNKVGIVLLPVYYHRNRSDPLQYLKRAKMMMDRKKLSMEAFLSHQIGYFVMKYFGAKVASLLEYKVICNTSFTISNVVGPREEITVTGIPITYMRATSSSLPHAITMHMVSYAGKADMQILVAKDIIPDPEKLAKCFEDALLEMKQHAVQT
ncbi:O-acyltransferase WSD1 isoform X1 [Helianthus annuus]|uniref:O-acyltransferase WSD1 isoform X1 n=1 Tax=Helianthus annuus TaxID=4232 RepID=UPI000B8FDF40|nr:O-acyltransferase WSD1 isoform X1 [Helianthus annuus]